MIHSLILRTATRLIVPVILLLSVFFLTWGHHQPGGGFSGGLIAALAFSLYAFAYGTEEAQQALPLAPQRLIAAGLALALLAGLLAPATGGAFLAARWAEVSLSNEVSFLIGSPMLFEAGIYLIVTGTVLAFVFAFEEAFTSILPVSQQEERE